MPELLSAYRFSRFEYPARVRDRMRVKAGELGLLGTVLVAGEGMNFSLGGAGGALDEWLAWLDSEFGIGELTSHRQAVDPVPFLRLKVRLRPEIITFDPELRPGEQPAGESLSPQQWHARLGDEALQLVDTRNDYEYQLGSFESAINPDIDRFTEFRDWALANLDPDRPVAMFCTGGVRCEKASAWLLANGFETVYQLDGGILAYLAELPPERSRWRGECFVFDDRVSVGHDLEPSGRPVCAACRRPAEGLGRDGMPPVDGSGRCGLCPRQFSAPRLAGVRERVRQIALARSRGQAHLGPQPASAEGGATTGDES